MMDTYNPIEDMLSLNDEHRCVVCGNVDFYGDHFDLGPDAPNEWLCEDCQSEPSLVPSEWDFVSPVDDTDHLNAILFDIEMATRM